MRIFRISSLAAAVMLVVGGTAFFTQSHNNPAYAFEQAAEKRQESDLGFLYATVKHDGGVLKIKYIIKDDFIRYERLSDDANLQAENLEKICYSRDD